MVNEILFSIEGCIAFTRIHLVVPFLDMFKLFLNFPFINKVLPSIILDLEKIDGFMYFCKMTNYITFKA